MDATEEQIKRDCRMGELRRAKLRMSLKEAEKTKHTQ